MASSTSTSTSTIGKAHVTGTMSAGPRTVFRSALWSAPFLHSVVLAAFAALAGLVVACGSDLGVIGRNVTGSDGVASNDFDGGAVDAGASNATDAGSGNPDVHGDDVDAGVVIQGGCVLVPAGAPSFDVKSEGAVGDGLTDDTAAIQSAITKAIAGAGIVTIPDGTYLVAPATSTDYALTIAGATTLKLSAGAVLKAKPGVSTGAALLFVPGSNVHIVGGTIRGDRGTHPGTSDAEGAGVQILAAANVDLDGVTVEDFWTDGIAVDDATNVTLCGVRAEHNRRRGLGASSVEGLTVSNSSFSNTYGIAPAAGIVLDAVAGDTIHNVLVRESGAAGNSGGGVRITAIDDPSSNAFEMTFSGVRVIGNQGDGFGLVGATGVKILGSSILDNTGDGIDFGDRTKANNASGNTITGNGGVALHDTTGANEASNNTF